MISTYQDYRRYLEADRRALGRHRHYGLLDRFVDPIWTYERLMRRIAYLQNVRNKGAFSFLFNCWRRILWLRYHRLGQRLGFSIGVNSFGEGLAIWHWGTIVVNEGAQIGKNAQIHVGVNIGKNFERKTPKIGDNCYFGPGAKIFGDVVLGDNVKIGANAVVNKSFPEGNCTLVGVPARKVCQ